MICSLSVGLSCIDSNMSDEMKRKLSVCPSYLDSNMSDEMERSFSVCLVYIPIGGCNEA